MKINKKQVHFYAAYGYRMDIMFTKIYKALSLLTAIAFMGVLSYQDYDPGLHAFIKKANKLNSYDLEAYEAFYLQDLEDNGFNVDSLTKVQEKRSIRFKDMGRNTIGRADGMFESSEVNVKISPHWWKKLNNAERMYVVYHEYGHDYWFKWHGSSWIMARSKRATGKITWKKLYERRQEYFNTLKKDKGPKVYWYMPQKCKH